LVRGLIFDVDGTLVSLKVDREKLLATTTAVLDRLGFDTSFIHGDTLHTQEIIERARLQIKSGAVATTADSLRSSLNEALDALEMEWNARAEPITGTSEVLAVLRSQGVILATLTNSGRAPSDWLLKRHGLLGLFDFTLTRDDVPALKPSPDGIVQAVKRMGVPRDQVVYVGDSIIDVRAARGAGVRIASVTTGRYTFERLRHEGTDYILTSLSELPDLVRRA
jgi:HAD superfamily hydrolase (TIGR01549 family)